MGNRLFAPQFTPDFYGCHDVSHQQDLGHCAMSQSELHLSSTPSTISGVFSEVERELWAGTTDSRTDSPPVVFALVKVYLSAFPRHSSSWAMVLAM